MPFISHDLAAVRDVLTRPQHEDTRSLLAAVPMLRTDREMPLAMIP